MPEFELGQPADKGPEFLVLLGRQAAAGVAVLDAFVLGERRVKLGRQEGQEEVQEVDSKRVGDDVPALGDDDAEEEEEEDCHAAQPAVGYVGGGFVEVGLVSLCRRSVNMLNGTEREWWEGS